MSESRKSRLSIDGGQVKEDENVASYKPIPDADAEFRSKPTLSKSKEKISDEAEEKLLDKEEEAKIVTRVDMADAMYVVGDHRNGDAKIELDANKRQFSGLSKEELLKYADDPFWVRLRWFMFVLFWALWLCMLAGAIGIIVRAPKCAAPQPRTWYERGPIVDTSSADSYSEVTDLLSTLAASQVQAVFIDVAPTYEALDDPNVLEEFKKFVNTASSYGIKVIVDLIPNFVSTSHQWFLQSVNRTAPYDKYFTWDKGGDYVDGKTEPEPKNNWVSTMNTSAWEWNEDRKEYYLHQFDADQPDLNFHNEDVVREFEKVIEAYMKAGAAGVRLDKVRHILVNQSLPMEIELVGRGSTPEADHLNYAYYKHEHTTDQPGLRRLLDRWSLLVGDPHETVFTIKEKGDRPELFLRWEDLRSLRPALAAPARVAAGAGAGADAAALAALLRRRLARAAPAPALALTSDGVGSSELGVMTVMLPGTPMLFVDQVPDYSAVSEPKIRLSHLLALRNESSFTSGQYALSAVPDNLSDTNKLLACARWDARAGYVALYQAGARAGRANLTLAAARLQLPAALAVYRAPAQERGGNSTYNQVVQRDDILVPPMSVVILSYVPTSASNE